jgi:hypothetical protein
MKFTLLLFVVIVGWIAFSIVAAAIVGGVAAQRDRLPTSARRADVNSADR